MSNTNEVVSALKELECDLSRFGVASSAIVYPDCKQLPDSIRSVYNAINQAGSLNYSLGACDIMYIEGSDHRIETRRLTNDVIISTLAGKLVLPSNIKLRMASRR